MKKNVVFSIMAVLVIGGLLGFKWYSGKNPDKVPGMTEVIKQQKEENFSTVTNLPAVKTVDHEMITTEKPINGTKKGVIEVGASGFNCFIVDIDQNKNWELVSKDFGTSLAYEGFMSVDDVKSGMKQYLTKIFDGGVAGRNVHFVMSSGALKNPKTEMIAKGIEKNGYIVNRITADQEGKFALRALLPKNYKDNSYVVDIGSGNTKISWYTGDKMTSVECSGAKYYQDSKTDQDVYNEVKTVVSKVPEANRKHCFIIGGAPFKMAGKSRNAEERFTMLKNPDEYSAGEDAKLKSGLNIYRALYETTNADFVFDWDANFTIGFLMTLN